MKKSLIALAVLAVSGASMAQSSVTLYGIADVSFGSTKNTVTVDGVSASVRQTELNSGGISGSRWGVKGSEDLGGGLKANFNLEQGFALDTGAAAGVQFDRQAWVGVSGGFGDVKLGRSGTAYDDIVGTYNNTFDSSFTAKPWVSYAGVVNNQLYYATPSIGGITAAVSYALGEDKGAKSAGKIFALNVQYAAGPLMLGYAHQAETQGAGTQLNLGVVESINSTLTDFGAVPGDLLVAPAGSKATYNLLAGSYDLGVAKLLASFNTTKLSEEGVAGDLKFNEFQIGADIPVATNTTLAVGYGQSKAKFEGESLYKAKAISAAVSYSLSKRTSVYAGFNNTKLTGNATNFFDGTIKSTNYAAGVKHTF